MNDDITENTSNETAKCLCFYKGIQVTAEYLELFLKNLLAGENNKLKNRYLHIQWNDEKQDIENSKQDIGPAKQDIELPDGLSAKTKKNILQLDRF